MIPVLNRLSRMTLLLLSALIVTSPSFAQGSPAASNAKATPDISKLSIEDLMNVTVTAAAKKPEKQSETPAAVFVITKDDIERYGYRTLTQALRRVVGFYGATDHNYEYLGVRGFAPMGDYNTRVLLLLDGHRLNDNLYDMAPVGQDLPVDMHDIDRIEVIKGPGSALWGTNALLSVINIVTKTGKDVSSLDLLQDSGSAERSCLQYGKEVGEKNDAFASVSSYHSA